MIYDQLFRKCGKDKHLVRAGVIGTGNYATAIITQARSIPGFEVSVIVDLNVDAARRALSHAGWDENDYVICESRAAAFRAFEGRKIVVAQDAAIMMELPIDIVVESTGSAIAGAHHGQLAVHHGKHLAMVTKEADVVVGPILKYKADKAGLVYTAVDGDQHGLLIGLVNWARVLGLELLCGGKALEFDVVVDPGTGRMACEDEERVAPAEQRRLLAPTEYSRLHAALAPRRAMLGGMCSLHGYDVTEMALAANGTGLVPDTPELHCPVLHATEIPDVLAPREFGGILARGGAIDAVSCLRQPRVPGLAGGVFIVVTCQTAYAREILLAKGHTANASGDAFLITRAHHLCGVETPLSLMCAVRLGLPTGAIDYRPAFDVYAQVVDPLSAGEFVPTDKSRRLRALMRQGLPMDGSNPVPLHIASGCRLRRAVAAGEVLTLDAIEPEEDTARWRLRREQDRHFLTETSLLNAFPSHRQNSAIST